MYAHVDANTCDEQSTELEANKRKKKEQRMSSNQEKKKQKTRPKSWLFADFCLSLKENERIINDGVYRVPK